MPQILYTIGVLALTAGLALFAYLDRVYRELGRIVTGRIFAHLQTFEVDIEPRFKMDRQRAALAFTLLARLWLVLVAAVTARGVIFFVPGSWEAALEMVFFLSAEVIVLMQFLPSVLLAGVRGNWIASFVPAIRVFVWIIWPVQAVLELLVSVLHLSEDDPTAEVEEQQSIEAFVDAAADEGIIERDEARLIEQVIEFGDKRVRDLMARDILEVSDRDAAHRTVRELMRPALFIPETKSGSELLKEMQRKNQQMANVIDEYGLMAGVVTVEDLIEEIVGDLGEEDRRPAPDVVREAGGSMVMRGSVPVDKLTELLGVQLDDSSEHSGATTIAGLLNSVAGHVPRMGEVIDSDGVRFEVLEANQRKVLRVRARRVPAGAASSSSA